MVAFPWFGTTPARWKMSRENKLFERKWQKLHGNFRHRHILPGVESPPLGGFKRRGDVALGEWLGLKILYYKPKHRHDSKPEVS